MLSVVTKTKDNFHVLQLCLNLDKVKWQDIFNSSEWIKNDHVSVDKNWISFLF